MVDLDRTQTQGISRRTVTKAMAWAVPAVAVAATVPVTAASELITITQPGPACKLPGNSCQQQGWSKGYLQPLQICNGDDSATITVTITTPAFLTINGEVKEFTPVPSAFVIGPDQCQRVILNLNLQDNSEQSNISGTLHWTWASDENPQRTGSGTTQISTTATPPCKDCTV